MNKLKDNRWNLVSAACCVLLAGAAVAVSQQQQPISQPGIKNAEEISVTFRDVARNVLPAVVSIETRTKAVQISNDGQGPGQRSPTEEEFFKRFFGGNLPPGLEDNFRRGQMPERRGSGSGFIIDGAGVILTNAHVVEGADQITIVLQDGREVEATEWHADARSDVAIVRIDAGGPLASVPLGDSSQMEIGDWVLAMGNPFDVGMTVTSGIISAKGRNAGINEVESYLQTDAAINPGNSGGPLVNLRGEVVGINTAISTRSGGYDGVGFAIPINTAHWVADQLVATGSVKRAYLGVSLQPMSSELRKQFGVKVGEGALVASVYDGSPAAEAGLDAGDVIVEFADQKVSDSTQLQGIVEKLTTDKSYPLTVLRGGERVQIDVTLKQMPGDFTPAMKRAMQHSSPSEPKEEFDQLGLSVLGLDSEPAKQLGLSEDAQGVLVGSIEQGSPAAEVGLRPGDVIQKVGTHAVTSPEEFAAAIKDASLDDGVVLLVRRGGGSQFVVLKTQR